MNRYFINRDLKNQEVVSLEGEELHHLARVMRKSAGDICEIINGNGKIAIGVIVEIQKNRASVAIKDVIGIAEKKPKIIIAQAMPRFSRLEYILEKGTELGMSKIILFPGEKSEKKSFSENQKERMKKIVISATKQCGRVYLPKIQLEPELKKWKKPDGKLFFGDISKNAPTLIKTWGEIKKPIEKILFFIGPESGFDQKEVEILHNIGATGIKLHENILRTDTAPIAALSIIHQLLF